MRKRDSRELRANQNGAPIEIILHRNPDGVAAPFGRYSHLVIAPSGHPLMVISGQIGMDPAGDVAADAYHQTRQIFANIDTLLASVAARPRDIVRLLTFVAGTQHVAGFRRARDEVYATWYPDGAVPAATLAVVVALATPELLVEVEGTVALP